MPPLEKSKAVIATVGIYCLWTLLTYIFEGRLLTIHRPEAVLDRLTYTVVSNIIVGIGCSMVLMHILLKNSVIATPSLFGIIGSGRQLIAIAAGLVLGLTFFFTQTLPSKHPILIVNAYSQVIVVSMAEVIVCWVLVGGALVNLRDKPIFIILALIITSILFGIYHIGHSPPFNTLKMIAILTIVGLFTGFYYFISRSIYGTILFHNFMGMKGVTEALANGGQIDAYKTFQLPIIATAVASLIFLIAMDVFFLRRY